MVRDAAMFIRNAYPKTTQVAYKVRTDTHAITRRVRARPIPLADMTAAYCHANVTIPAVCQQ